MNASSRSYFIGAVLALLLPLACPALAQPPPAAEKSAPPPPSAANPDTAPAPDATREDDRSKLRRIDQVEPAAEAPPVAQEKRRPPRRSSGGEFPFGDHSVPAGGRIRDVVSIFGSTSIAGQVDSDAVSIGGGTYVSAGGRVGGAAVAVLGHLESEGEIRGEAVSVLGGVKINGPVRGQAVAVLGNMELGSKAVIEGDVVVVGGRLTKDPNAVVHGNEVGVPVFGALGNTEWLTTWLKRCLIYGRPLAFGAHLGWAWAIAFSFLAFYLLLALLFRPGLVRCVETLETRPGYSVLASVLTVLLTPVAIVLLAITIVGALLVPFLGMGLLCANLFGKAVMLAWIGRRFTRFFGNGPLGHPAFAVLIGGLIVLLLYTVPVVGFVSYKLLSWLGLGVVVYTIALAMKREKRPVAVAPGTIPPGAMGEPEVPYPNVPVEPTAPAAPAVSPLAASGVVSAPAMSAGFSGAHAEPAPLPPVPPVPDAGPAVIPPSMADVNPVAPPPPPIVPPMPSPLSSSAAAAVPPPIPPVSAARPYAAPPPRLGPAVAWPRAGFFIRLAALALDGVLVGLILAFLTGLLPRALQFHNGPGGWLLALAIYGAIMWKHKGTTIGGIVCGLKVVRMDNRELDWATAVVRALGCFLSLAVAGLGFIWIAIDSDRQSWHDKIAGTVVVLVPKGVSLV